ncbi:MAG: hypothetical protein HONBIEJF_00877 [Fimbriimonadaceae bacterium]|nr:hypothetical protein [Fimbriimonadaceae bacterium]
MSRFNKLRWMVWLIPAIGVAGYVRWHWDSITRYVKMDPYSYLAKSDPILGGDVGIKLRDVELWHYEGSRLAGKAHVHQATVTRARDRILLDGIDQGHYIGKDKESQFDFVADRAEWFAANNLLVANEGAKIKNKDFDLASGYFSYNQNRRNLSVPGKVTGRLGDGQVEAISFVYQLDKKEYQIGPATWVGQVQTPAEKGKTKWTIKTQGIAKRIGDTETWGKAEATDGEVVVFADRLERNVKTDVITATGNVRYFSAKSNMTCEKVVVYRKDRRAVATGNVQMVIKPKDQEKLEVGEIPPIRPIVPDDIAKDRPPAPIVQDEKALDDEVRSGDSRRKYPTFVYCEKVEYWYQRGERRAIITGSPQARQEMAAGRWRMGWANRALYDGEKDTLRLLASDGKKDVRVKTSLGDDLVASWFQVSTKEDDESWEGEGIQGDVFVDEEEEGVDRGNSGSNGGGTGGGTGGR